MQLGFVISILNQTYIPEILLLNQRGKEQLQGRNGAKMLPLEKEKYLKIRPRPLDSYCRYSSFFAKTIA